jgi:hypothetical protein
MKVVPVNFGTEHRSMLSNLHVLVSEKYLIIPEEHKELIISLRTAFAKDLSLDKEATSYDDLLDSLRMSCIKWNLK